ncbi:protein FAR1-RELATED SEQUENCE 5-like [Arachis ipaensis]|uniref:protein FAR1-RELATED SEQUENCE 5-like n=1 Tax=Arachis ipaensis TaxID=130454 RepID=UPI0007AF6700|nr:protein FAR1-RELATED SEQUENCE 5-like [Arachis ipaensis]
MNDFAVRKNKIQRNVKNEVTQQEFVCFRQGSRDIRFVNDGLRQNREPKAETRCGCEAEMRVHENGCSHCETNEHDAESWDYSSFVHTGEGFQNVPFLKRDMYNQIGKQRRLIGGDAMSCLKFLESTAQENPGIQLDYRLFGDVVPFDVTYRKNKYVCPLVVFFGVNHHNKTNVFAAMLVANENEHTYT